VEPLDYPEGRESLFVLARGINDFMPSHMLTLTTDALARVGKDIRGAKIAILGWAFLNNSDDARNTPSEVYRDLCLAEGAEVVVHDPYVLTYPGVDISQEKDVMLADADVVAIFTGHSQYRELDPVRCCGLMGQAHPVLVDGRNVADPDAWIAEGFVYKGIGRGDKNGHLLTE